MYVLSNSLLQHTGDYKVEVYDMQVLDFEIAVSIDLKIFGEGSNEFYVADYVITRSIDEKTTFGTCMNQPTKEAIIELVEATVIEAMQNVDKMYWE